ncbi:uncharacterized protein PADG_11226 [Paracoccidioides brasiliensis Pb18]|uniref:Uncharacterized protein n=1 Tax=Paracoccidioides brasiliensis (strain Pb18) TaxID=502780 RepID=A0A0A0HVL5_PARBD|nr:uncharacterized protein PADG_11226 [Paracoccidioides brasiliensis Pb18]KGM92413.1 hypothetical protein PADG_11226 [Paracoccidioides brasiliensis Pb18]
MASLIPIPFAPSGLDGAFGSGLYASSGMLLWIYQGGCRGNLTLEERRLQAPVEFHDQTSNNQNFLLTTRSISQLLCREPFARLTLSTREGSSIITNAQNSFSFVHYTCKELLQHSSSITTEVPAKRPLENAEEKWKIVNPSLEALQGEAGQKKGAPNDAKKGKKGKDHLSREDGMWDTATAESSIYEIL